MNRKRKHLWWKGRLTYKGWATVTVGLFVLAILTRNLVTLGLLVAWCVAFTVHQERQVQRFRARRTLTSLGTLKPTSLGTFKPTDKGKRIFGGWGVTPRGERHIAYLCHPQADQASLVEPS